MIRMIAIAFLFIGALLAQGCSEDNGRASILGVQPLPRQELTVFIVGPRVIDGPGSFQWSAVVTGDDSDLSYEWSVSGGEEMDAVYASDGNLLTIAVETSVRGPLEISLSVRSADGTVVAREVVTICPGSPAMDWCTPYQLVEPERQAQRALSARMVAAR